MFDLAEQLGNLLSQNNKILATAESCTGGWLSQIITSVPGSSAWFDRGFVPYSNAAKAEMLGVSTRTLEEFGAVSEEAVLEMAAGALQLSHANISCAVTGVAGPSGGSDEKPVGTVWIGFAGDGMEAEAIMQQFSGDRETIRRLAVEFTLEVLIKLL